MATNKDRKSEEQKRYEEADNAGLFAGDDADAKAAREQATANVTADDTRPRLETPIADEDAQNVRAVGNRIEGEEAEKARNKATEGIRQNRDK
jgi:hypothetical protein